MWVIRAGQDSLYFEKYIHNSRVFIPWEGYNLDLSLTKTRTDYRFIVEKEKNTTNRTSVSNWAGQLFSFVHEIRIGDYALLPSKGSRTYHLTRIKGPYQFNAKDNDKLYHSREIEIIETDIPREIFPQPIIYSLGAYRTIFKVKQENEVLKTIEKWRAVKK